MSKFSDVKKNRIILALIAGVTILAISFFLVEIYEIITLFNRNKTINRLNNEIVVLQESLEENQEELEKWDTEWQILQRARELGLYEKEDDE